MGPSIILAQVMSLVYIAVGIGLIVNTEHYRRMVNDFSDNAAILYIGAFMAIILGYIIVVSNNIWEWSWVLIITIIGWLALIKGIALLIFPRPIMKWYQSYLDKKATFRIEGVLALILGLVLGYFGFIR